MKSNSLKKTEKSLPFYWYYDHKIFQKEIDKITKPEYKISFIADGVIIKK